jgi:AcrR family transcriptional regulator/DNA-binding MarR family transcriptional regulator
MASALTANSCNGVAPRARRGSAGVARGAVDRTGGRGGVAEIQRARMLGALVEVAREQGARGITVSHVVARSGVSRRTFYELFEDRDDCFLTAFDLAVERAAQRVCPAFRGPAPWRERIRAALGALLEFLEDEPGMGALCVVDALGAGPQALARRASVIDVLIDAVDEGRTEARTGSKPTRLTAEGVVGAVLGVLHSRLTAAGLHGNSDSSRRRSSRGAGPQQAPQSVVSLLGPLMGMIVLPYLGPAAAARETARPAPSRRRTPPSHGDPLRNLEMRLTYRTVRVLIAIADNPGASNRRVADVSGVSDQGQISKLLTRLEHLGLIDNACAAPARGEPNAWRLTSRGEEVERALRQQAAPAAPS